MKTILLSLIAAVAFVGCDTTDDIDNAFDCSDICHRYRSCFDSSYDVDACRSRCRSRSQEDKSVQAKADVCDACMDDRSCTEAAFQCSTECAGLVP